MFTQTFMTFYDIKSDFFLETGEQPIIGSQFMQISVLISGLVKTTLYALIQMLLVCMGLNGKRKIEIL